MLRIFKILLKKISEKEQGMIVGGSIDNPETRTFNPTSTNTTVEVIQLEDPEDVGKIKPPPPP